MFAMATIPEVFSIAVKHHQSGQLKAAEEIYRQILAVDPNQADAWHLLGVLAAQVGKPGDAIDLMARAIRIHGLNPAFHINQGNAYLSMQRAADAARCYERALELAPNSAEALYRLGNVMMQQRNLSDAAQYFQRSIQLNPDFAEVHNNLGSVLKDLGNLDAAVACYRQAVRLKPDDVPPHYNLGIGLKELGHLDEAATCQRRALELNPHDPEVHSCLGNVLSDQGDLDEAAACHRRALELDPSSAEAHKAFGLTLLKAGHWNQGWSEYSWRWQTQDYTNRQLPLPLWNGQHVPDSTVVLHAEQGLGDTIQFVRYAPLVKARAGRVMLHCPPELARLLSTCPGVQQVEILKEHLPAPAFHVSLMNLPQIFGTTDATIPAGIPYLVADPGLTKRWGEELGPREGCNIGVVWQGNPGHKNDRNRSFAVTRFASIAALPGVRLFSLQKGAGAEQLYGAGGHLPITNLGHRLFDFQETAAVLNNLDLLICPDTSITHLAGALGVPVWVALPFAADWRWLLSREDSPWYPTLRLYRQPQPGNYDTVFERMALDVRQLRIPGGKHDLASGHP